MMRKSFCVDHKTKINVLKHAISTFENMMDHFQSQEFGLKIVGLRIEGEGVVAAWNPDSKHIEFYNYETDKPMALEFEDLTSKELDCMLYSICALSCTAINEIPDNRVIDASKVYEVTERETHA